MSSSSPRPAPTPSPDTLLHVDVRVPDPDGPGPDHVRHRDDWSAHVQQMAPDDLRMLALSLPLIEQAKGILMGHYGCDAGTAFAILRRWSSSRQLKLRDLAAALVEEASRVDHGRDGQRRPAVERFVEAEGLA